VRGLRSSVCVGFPGITAIRSKHCDSAHQHPHEGGLIVHAELAKDAAQVRVHGIGADPQRTCGCRHATARRNADRNLCFRRGQVECRREQPRVRRNRPVER
jgi:hypothetical protein